MEFGGHYIQQYLSVPMGERLGAIAMDHAFAHRMLFALLSVLSLSDPSTPYFTQPYRLEVVGTAASICYVGLLVCLDYRDRALAEVRDAVSAKDLQGAEVMQRLTLSPGSLDATYNVWVNRQVAARVGHRMIAAGQILFHARLAWGSDAGCGWVHQAVCLPTTTAMLAVLLLPESTRPPWLHKHTRPYILSLVYLSNCVALCSSNTLLTLSGDQCMTGLHKSSSSSMPLTALMTFLHVLLGFLCTPVMLVQLPAVSVTTLACTVLTMLGRLAASKGKRLGWEALAECRWHVFVVAFTAVLTVELCCTTRYYFAQLNLRSFVNKICPEQAQRMISSRPASIH